MMQPVIIYRLSKKIKRKSLFIYIYIVVNFSARKVITKNFEEERKEKIKERGITRPINIEIDTSPKPDRSS
jgi:hypothetical protein